MLSGRSVPLLAAMFWCGHGACAEHATFLRQPDMTPAHPTEPREELAAIFAEIPESVRWLVGSLLPKAPGLAFDSSAEANAGETLTRSLLESQALVQRAIAISAQDLGIFPPITVGTPDDPDAHMRHPVAHIRNIARMLLADASRAYEAGNASAAVARLAATVRFARQLLRQTDALTRSQGEIVLTTASLKVDAMVVADPALMRRADRESVQALVDAYTGLDAGDPGSAIAMWESEARETLRYCRERFATPGGAERYAAYLTEFGAFEGPLGSVRHLLPALEQGSPAEAEMLRSMLDSLVPTKEHAAAAADLTATEIAGALDDAESMIGPIAAALRQSDLKALVHSLRPVTQDPTQLARVVCGGAGLTSESAATTRRIVSNALDAIQSLQPE
jgi:hypothetical protein